MTTTAPSASAPGEHIDESLYSRQLYVLGHEAMRRMQTSNVLIVGLNGLGVEVAKNVILTGVKSVTLYDPKPVSWMDLSSQFYLTEAHIGKNRVECSLNHLKELNPYVPVKELTGDLTENVLASFNVVVFTDHNIAQLVNYNEIARKYGVKFIAGEIRGLFGAVFVDCGNGFEIFDVDGENTVSNIVTNITNENPALVNVHDDKKTHGLYDGDLVAFEDVEGMPEVNEAGPFEIKSTGKHTFTINIDATKFGKYKSGGFVKQLKKKKVMDFLPLKEALKTPLMLETDFAKLQRPAELHACFRALGDFLTQKGRLPAPYNAEDANAFVELAKAYHDQIEVAVAQKFAYTASGNLNPIAAFIGGIVAQEVQKACSGKFHPINQFLYFDSLEALPDQLPTEADAAPINSRYDGQIVVFGNEFQKKLMNKKAFVVGSGALGCEYLKNFAVMGLGCGPEGKVYVTDMDSIEISNLNRQFLFRKHHVGQLKSVVAAAVAKEMNPSFNVVALSDKVAPQTEEIFDDEFWGSLDVIVNALDNVQARLYVDSRCVYYRKPLIEAGTLGTKGNVQVVIPFLTESYGSSPDPPEQEIPICTLKNFPNAIEHTIQWARDLFEGFFKQASEDVNAYLSKPDFLKELETQGANKRSTLESVFENLVTSKPLSFDECIIWARLKFEQYYNNSIQQLLYNFPTDMITASGTPFWGGPKRPPTPLKFHATDKTHLGFIIAAANLRAEMYGLKGPGENYDYQGVLASIHVPQYTPKTAKIATTEAEAKSVEVGAEDEQVCDEIVSKLPSPSSLAGFRMNTINFEKDDDTNFHMDFITAASNLRARNYKIKEADKHQTKGIAGKIIPAMVTTTALITGLGAAELIKYAIGKTKVEDYKNSFVNIAIPFVTLSEPVPPAKKQMKEKPWTLWDRLEISVGRDMTLKEFMEEFEKKFGFSISMMSSGQAVIYSFFGNKKKLQERMVMPLSEAVKEVAKIELGAKQKYINFEVCCTDEEGEDVDVPYVRYQFRNF